MIKIKEILHRKKPLIAAITAGDPDLKTTEKLLKFFDKIGVDMAELALPFNAALALSPEEETSFNKALQNEVDLTAVFALIKKIKKRSSIVIILKAAFNLFLSYGLKRFFADASAAGLDGVIIEEFSPADSAEIKELAQKNNIALIYTTSLSASERGLLTAAEKSDGYLRLAAIDSAEKMDLLKEKAQAIKKITTTPLMAVCNATETYLIYELFDFFDGVIVDRELLRRLDISTKELKKYLKKLMKELNR